MCQLPQMVLMKVTCSTAVQMRKGCRLCFSSGNGTWSNRLQRRRDKDCVKGECGGHDMGSYELQYGEGEVFEAVLSNGPTLHICIQFSMLHFLAEQLVMLIPCSYGSCIARISRAFSNEAHPLQLLPCKTEDGEGMFGLILSTRQREEKGCYTAA